MATEAQKKAIAKYKKNRLKRIPLEFKLEKYDLIKQYADAAGESVSGYIKKAVENRMMCESPKTDN